MIQLAPFLVLIAIAAVVLAAAGAAVGWYNEEGRRIRRGVRRVLKDDPHALILARGTGRGAGLNFTSNTMAVAWDAGSWCLVYKVDELIGVELIVDGQVAGRAFRNEPRRPVDAVGGATRRVSLRLVFDDPHHADFILDLWRFGALRRPPLNADEAVEEGNRWLARLDSVFRRKAGRTVRRAGPEAAAEPRPAPPFEPAAAPASEAPPAPRTTAAAPAAAAAAPPEAGPEATRLELPFDAPPWDDSDEDEERAAR